MMLNDISWIVLEWLIKTILAFLGYGVLIVFIFTISLLAIKFPFLEKVAVWGFILVPNVLSKIIGKFLLNKMCGKISIIRHNIEIPKTTVYPSLIFSYDLDSKAQIKFVPIKLTAYVYLERVFMGKIHWTKNEKPETKKKEKTNLSVAPELEVDKVPDLLAEKFAKIRLNFTPPLEVFKPKYFENRIHSHCWRLETVITFSTRLGDVSKKFSRDFLVNEDQLEEIWKRFS